MTTYGECHIKPLESTGANAHNRHNDARVLTHDVFLLLDGNLDAPDYLLAGHVRHDDEFGAMQHLIFRPTRGD